MIEKRRSITAAARPKALNVFYRSSIEILGSNHIRGMDVCLGFLCVCLCVRLRLETDRPGSPTK
jgi:hypothetical protein